MPRSLVLVTVDCLRADHVGFLGYPRDTTPFMDSLAKSSTTFENAIVAGTPTYYSFPAIMASRYPLAWGRDVVGISPGETTIASALRDEGYATAAFLAGNPYLSPRFGYNTGFDTFRDFLDTPPLPAEATTAMSKRGKLNAFLNKAAHRFRPGAALYDELYFRYCQRVAKPADPSLDALRRFPSADVLVNEASEWLENLPSGPSFLWLHFMDPHSPYYPKEEALDLMGHDTSAKQARYANSYWNREELSSGRLASRRDEIMELYDAGIRWADFQVGRLVDKLRALKLWEDCVFALTADHGEEFLEHGGRYHSPSKLNEELVHVPLLIHGHGLQPQRIPQPFSMVDLAPTLFRAMDVDSPGSFRGKSFFYSERGNHSRPPVITESVAACKNPFDSRQRTGSRAMALRDSIYKMVIEFSSSRTNLFNLVDDPQELHPLPSKTEKPVRRRLLEAAKAHLSESSRTRAEDSRLNARLRDLRLESADSRTLSSVLHG